MTDPLSAEVADGGPHLLRPDGLPGVRNAVQPRSPGAREHVAEVRPVDPGLAAAEAEADQTGRWVAQRCAQGVVGAGGAVASGDVIDPGQLDAVGAADAGCPAVQGLGEFVGRDPRPEVGDGGDRDLGVEHALRGQVGAEPEDQRLDVGRRPEQPADRGVDPDEVREVAEGVEVLQAHQVSRNSYLGVPRCQLRDRVGRRGSDQVHVQVNLGPCA